MQVKSPEQQCCRALFFAEVGVIVYLSVVKCVADA